MKTQTALLLASLAWPASLLAQDAPPAAPPQAQPNAITRIDAPSPAVTPAPAAAGDEGVTLNFKDAPLNTVLDYLSQAGGFIIVYETEVSGNISVVSHQPLKREEVGDLLNTLLYSKGYAAIQSGRTLLIVNRDSARQRNIPVMLGSSPETIPNKDVVVTQILPVRYANASQLISDLQPLIPETATVTANDSSNALVITDTQANIRHLAEIIEALDSSISDVSTIRIYPLNNANAAETAKLLTELFSGNGPSGSSRGSSSDSDRSSFFRSMMERSRSSGGPGGPPGGFPGFGGPR